jgi:cytidylate kinase
MPDKLVELARQIHIEVGENRVTLDGREVTAQIRDNQVTDVTHYAANNPGVRAILVELQRRAAGNDDLVTEGRDQGTIVFPQAECKIYLTASPEERARRRAQELTARGQPTSVEDVLRDQARRDTSDATRTVGPMVAADDAVEVATDGLDPRQVLDRLEALVREKMTP